MTIAVLAVGWALIFGFSMAQDKINSISYNKDNIGSTLGVRTLAFVASLSVVIINTALFMILMNFSDSEKRSTITSFNISLAKKLTFGQFFNTALTVFLVNLVAHGKEGFYKRGGFIFDLWFIFLSNTTVPPIINLFDVWWFIRLYKRKQIKAEKLILTQRETNYWFEGSNPNMSSKYAAVIKTMWVTCFYSSILPLALPLSILGLIFVYWLKNIFF